MMNDTKTLELLIPYLKRRMEIHQFLLEKQVNNKIPFSLWLSQAKGFEEEIASSKDNILEEEKRKENYAKFLKKFENRITLTNEEITDILKEIENYIIQYGFTELNGNFHEASFLAKVFEKSLEKEKNEKIRDYHLFFSTRKDMGFEEILGSLISVLKNQVLVVNHEHNKVFSVTDGEVDQHIQPQDEMILLADHLYVGDLIQEEKPIFTIFLSKEVDGEIKMTALDYDFEDYSVQKENHPYVKIRTHLNEFLTKNGMGYCTKQLYNASSFLQIIDAFDALSKQKQEKKKNIPFYKIKQYLKKKK